MTTPFTKLTSNAVLLLADDVDTDQIIPARFLKTTTKEGLGAHLFADWRVRADFPLSSLGATDAKVLVVGSNFGCGSSREHAPWALTDFGFRAVVARSFADIFAQNAAKNGLLTVALGDEPHARVVEVLRAEPSTKLTVDLARQAVLVGAESFAFDVDPFVKRCLLNGLDELGYIFQFVEQIA